MKPSPTARTAFDNIQPSKAPMRSNRDEDQRKRDHVSRNRVVAQDEQQFDAHGER